MNVFKTSLRRLTIYDKRGRERSIEREFLKPVSDDGRTVVRVV